MRRKMIWIAPFGIVALAAFVFLGGWVVQHLWNWLLPSLFGWRMVTFWQALGLLALCRILFGNWGGHKGHRSNFRRRMDEKWEGMTPEEREKLRGAWRSRCGFGTPEGGAEAKS